MKRDHLVKIKEVFEEYFQPLCVPLPEENLHDRTAGQTEGEGWYVDFVFGANEKGEYLDFFAVHRMTNSRHNRIYSDGTQIGLEYVREWGYAVGATDEETRRNREEMCEHNERVYEILRKKGLLKY